MRAVFERDFASQRLWVLKDPRHGRLLPLWNDIVAADEHDVAFLHILRDPYCVARSLAARNSFSVPLSLLLWMRHNLEAERFTRDQNRVWIEFESLRKRPAATLAKACAELGVIARLVTEPSKELLGPHVDETIVHHAPGQETVDTRALFPWIERIHRALEQLVRKDDAGARRELDEVAEELKASERLLSGSTPTEKGSIAAELGFMREKQVELVLAVKGGLDGLFVQSREGFEQGAKMQKTLESGARELRETVISAGEKLLQHESDRMDAMSGLFQSFGERLDDFAGRIENGVASVSASVRTSLSIEERLLEKSLDLLDEFDEHLKKINARQEELQSLYERALSREAELAAKRDEALLRREELEQELRRREADVADRDERLEQQRTELDRALARTAELEAVQESIYRSRAWRLTRPLSALKAWVVGGDKNAGG